MAQVTPLTATEPWAKPQIFEQSAATADAYAVIAVTPANGVKVQYGSNNKCPGWGLSFPIPWLKPTRRSYRFKTRPRLAGNRDRRGTASSAMITEPDYRAVHYINAERSFCANQ